jgi:hypothetical protein
MAAENMQWIVVVFTCVVRVLKWAGQAISIKREWHPSQLMELQCSFNPKFVHSATQANAAHGFRVNVSIMNQDCCNSF